MTDEDYGIKRTSFTTDQNHPAVKEYITAVKKGFMTHTTPTTNKIPLMEVGGKTWIRQIDYANLLSTALEEQRAELAVTENTSDGYHTFKELYEFRKLYNAALFNEWSSRGFYRVHKSKRHSDGELCFGGGWFIVVATLPTGQISNHYELKDWYLFQCAEQETAETWDGHTKKDVVERLQKYLNGKGE